MNIHNSLPNAALQSHLHNIIIDNYDKICIQVNLIRTLSVGSMKTDRVISEPCYNEVIYYRYIAK